MEHLKRRWTDGNARFWGKECARLMLYAFFVKQSQYESTAPNLSWITRQAMLTRTDWRQIGETTMLHDKSGQTVEITEDTNLRYAIHAVIEFEYGYELLKLVSPWECADMLREAHSAADAYCDKKSGAKK
jgi:hypothetical protein